MNVFSLNQIRQVPHIMTHVRKDTDLVSTGEHLSQVGLKDGLEGIESSPLARRSCGYTGDGRRRRVSVVETNFPLLIFRTEFRCKRTGRVTKMFLVRKPHRTSLNIANNSLI